MTRPDHSSISKLLFEQVEQQVRTDQLDLEFLQRLLRQVPDAIKDPALFDLVCLPDANPEACAREKIGAWLIRAGANPLLSPRFGETMSSKTGALFFSSCLQELSNREPAGCKTKSGGNVLHVLAPLNSPAFRVAVSYSILPANHAWLSEPLPHTGETPLHCLWRGFLSRVKPGVPANSNEEVRSGRLLGSTIHAARAGAPLGIVDQQGVTVLDLIERGIQLGLGEIREMYSATSWEAVHAELQRHVLDTTTAPSVSSPSRGMRL